MRTLLNLAILFSALFAISCSSSKYAAQSTDDDIYYSSKDPKPVVANISTQDNQSAGQQKETGETSKAGNTYITNNYPERDFSYDDYYDYEYAARLKRFHNPTPSYGYYDDYYTNSYWYNQNPNNFGVSIYLGYSYWRPSYYMYSYQPNYFWGCDPFFYPRPYGYYGGYMNGYADGYWNGYYQGQAANYYFNSYDNNSYYYGPRKTHSTNHRTVASRESFGQKYQKAIAEEPSNQRGSGTSPSGSGLPMNPSSPVISSNPGSGTLPVSQPRETNSEPKKPVKEITPERPIKNIEPRNEEPVKNISPAPVREPKIRKIEEPVKNINPEPRPKAEPRNEIRPIINDYKEEPRSNPQPKNNNIQPRNNPSPQPAAPSNSSGTKHTPRRR